MKLSVLTKVAVVMITCSFWQAAAAQEMPVDSTFAGTNFSWSSVGGLLLRARPIVSDGKVWVCGAYSFHGGSRQVKLGLAVLKEGRIKGGAQSNARDLRFFASVNSRYDDVKLVGQTSKCKNTGVDAASVDLDDFEISLGAGRYRVRN